MSDIRLLNPHEEFSTGITSEIAPLFILYASDIRLHRQRTSDANTQQFDGDALHVTACGVGDSTPEVKIIRRLHKALRHKSRHVASDIRPQR